MRRLLGVLALTGCQIVFGLDEVKPPDAPLPIDAAIDAPDADLTIDTDRDGVDDGHDNCPAIANANQEDFDDDTRGDACDNCTAIANYDQHDEDTDAYGDACDNCPQLFNPDQNNGDLDGIGDACDSDPSAHDCLRFFDSFHDGPTNWSNARGTWAVEGDVLKQTDVTVYQGILLAPDTYTSPVVITHATITGGGAGGGNIGLWAGVTPNGNSLPQGFLGEQFDPFPNPSTYGTAVVAADETVTYPQNYMLSTGGHFEPGSQVTSILETRGAPAYTYISVHVKNTVSNFNRIDGANGPVAPTGRVGLRINTLTARFDFFLVLTRESNCPSPIIQ